MEAAGSRLRLRPHVGGMLATIEGAGWWRLVRSAKQRASLSDFGFNATVQLLAVVSVLEAVVTHQQASRSLCQIRMEVQT